MDVQGQTIILISREVEDDITKNALEGDGKNTMMHDVFSVFT